MVTVRREASAEISRQAMRNLGGNSINQAIGASGATRIGSPSETQQHRLRLRPYSVNPSSLLSAFLCRNRSRHRQSLSLANAEHLASSAYGMARERLKATKQPCNRGAEASSMPGMASIAILAASAASSPPAK